MQRDLTQLFIVIAIVVTGFVAVTFLSSTLEHQRVPVPAAFADSDLALEGKRLNGYALGSEGLLADWYWMMSLQYMGKKMIEYGDKDIDLENLSSLNIRLLYPYLDNATDLDPKFYAAYSYGAAVLPAINREHAIALIEKGIANNPEQWRFYQYLGYIYWRSKNFDKAAETYEAGSKIAGASPFMLEMAAAMRSTGGSRDTARSMYGQMLAQAQDEQSKRNAQLRLFQLDANDELDAVNILLDRARTTTGHCPARLNEIYPQLKNSKLRGGRDFRIDSSNSLVDPTGVTYRFDEKKCRAAISLESKIPPPIN